MTEIGGNILLILVLIGFNGLLAMSEIAVVSARKARLRQRADAGDAGAATALRLSEHPTRFLSTVQVGITLVGIFAGAFGGATIAAWIARVLEGIPPLAPYGEAIGLGVVVVAITYLSLIFGELVPKRIGLNNAEVVAASVSRPMLLLSRAAGPLVSMLTFSTETVLRLIRLRPADDGAVTEEEIRIMIAEGTQAGVFHEAEREIVESVFRLGDRQVSDLMQPRPRIVWLDADDPPEVNWSILTEESRSYVPVARGDLDNLLGVAPSKRLLASAAAGHPVDLLASLEQPTFVPETMSALRLLEHLRNAHPRIGMVIDEHGAIVGLVTPTDILEAIIGDLSEPGDRPEPAAVRRDDGSWLVDGLVPVGDLDELVGAGGLTDDERAAFRTVGGLVMHELARVPAPGDRVMWRGVYLEVLDMDGRRINTVLMTPASTPPSADRTDAASPEMDA